MAQKKITELQLRSSVTDGLNIPSDDGIQSYRVTALQFWNYISSKIFTQSGDLENLTLQTSVASSALTISVKTLAGTNPTASDKVRVAFRSATITSGAYLVREITGALSLVISSGSTLGQVNGQPSRIYVYLIDNAGTPELAVSHSYYPDNALVTTTAEGGAGAADSATAIYSATARSNVAIRSVGYVLNTQATAGTWASAGSQIQLVPFGETRVGNIVKLTAGSGTYYPTPGVKSLFVQGVGPGGGAGGALAGLTGTSTDGSADTTFGTSLLIGTKGLHAAGVNGAVGGTFTVNAPAIDFGSCEGGAGDYGKVDGGIGAVCYNGGTGGASIFGPGGRGGTNAATRFGQNGVGYGAGGGGGGNNTTGGISGGAGGSAGGGFKAVINNPLASYAWVVGTGGIGEAGSGGGGPGGNGRDGVIFVEERF